jgi:predicted CXXCH cytochrome family protein
MRTFRQLRPRSALAVWLWLSAVALGQAAHNPHWTKDGCGDCHKTAAGQALPVAPEAITPLCLSCHNGARAGAEAHPIGRTFDPQHMNNPGWPMPNGTVQCETCHDARQACDASAERPETNSAFLRPTSTPFCSNCHRPEAVPRLNPHLMLSAGQPIESKCAICHSRPMDNTSMVRTGDSALRADVVTLCRSCHPHHRDISTTGHVLATIPPDMLAYMRARELTGLLSMPSADLIQQLIDQKARPILMVPDGQGRVVCFTCHNPHQAGTFPAMSVLSDRSLRLVRGHLLTPVRGSQFCRHCHNL